MPTWLTFFVSVFLVGGGLVSLYLAIVVLIGGLKTKSRPRMGIAPGEGAGTINVWVTWNPKEYAVEVYRLRFTYVSPESAIKEGTFTVTFDKTQTAPFIQTVEFPKTFRDLLERDAGERALFTIEFKTKEEYTLAKNYTLAKLKRVYQGGSLGKVPSIANKLPLAKEDHPTVLSLDFSELTVRRKKLKDLEAAAKAKAKPAAAPAPAAKAATPTEPKPAAPAAGNPPPAPNAAPIPVPPKSATPAPQAQANAAPAAPIPASGVNPPTDKAADKPPSDKPAGENAPKSIRDVVSANNAKTAVEKP
jgi:hypothetical protein